MQDEVKGWSEGDGSTVVVGLDMSIDHPTKKRAADLLLHDFGG